MHAKVAGCSSNALNILWVGYKAPEIYIGDITENDLGVGNNYTENIKQIRLYNVVIQTYVSTTAAWIITGSVALVTIIAGFVAIIYAQMSPINIIDNTEHSILHRVSYNDNLIADRITAGGSNDAKAQRKYVITKNNVLYCRECIKNNKPYLIITTDSKYKIPDKNTLYH